MKKTTSDDSHGSIYAQVDAMLRAASFTYMMTACSKKISSKL